MGVLTFLSKAGKIILEGINVFTGFNLGGLITRVDPKAGEYVQTISKDLAQIGDAITTAEAMGQAIAAPGAQKLTMAAPLVAQILLDSAVVAGKPIANQDLFSQGAKKIADGMADVLNSIHPDAATSVSTKDALTPLTARMAAWFRRQTNFGIFLLPRIPARRSISLPRNREQMLQRHIRPPPDLN